jgi:lipocalin
MCGAVEAWDLSTEEEPSREAIIAAGDERYWWVLTRFLVSTPWGALL